MPQSGPGTGKQAFPAELAYLTSRHLIASQKCNRMEPARALVTRQGRKLGLHVFPMGGIQMLQDLERSAVSRANSSTLQQMIKDLGVQVCKSRGERARVYASLCPQ